MIVWLCAIFDTTTLPQHTAVAGSNRQQRGRQQKAASFFVVAPNSVLAAASRLLKITKN